MDHSVNLDPLPQGLEFPPELRNRIRYDSQRKAIVFHGFMSKATYDRLLKLHDNGEYRRAIENLFSQATYDLETSKRGRWTSLFVPVGVVLLVAIAAILIWWVTRVT